MLGGKNAHLLLRVEGGVENRASGREEAREVRGKRPWFSMSEVDEAEAWGDRVEVKVLGDREL